MYVPAPWLKKGENEIIIFEELKYNNCEIKGIGSPILDIKGAPKIYSIGGIDKTLKKSVLTLNCNDSSASIFYSIDGKKPTDKSSKYIHPLSFNKPVVVSVIGQKFDTYSDEILKINIHPSLSTASNVNIQSKYSAKYAAGGEQTIVDGFLGSNDLRDGFWQGYEGNDMNAIIDLGALKEIKKIKVNFLQDIKSWIFLPSQVEFSVSADGKDFTTISKISSEINLFEESSSIWKTLIDYSTTVMAGKKIRYVAVKANNIGFCPPKHPGAGAKAWLFVDEITIE
ncbi:MAG: chitobiase/beta-hexosaminidase C-terminal domain-containing protein [Bacteroidales bacterium]